MFVVNFIADKIRRLPYVANYLEQQRLLALARERRRKERIAKFEAHRKLHPMLVRTRPNVTKFFSITALLQQVAEQQDNPTNKAIAMGFLGAALGIVWL